jgi:hypothetical protein
MSLTAPHFSQPVASRVQSRAGRSARSRGGRLVTFSRPRQTRQNPSAAMMTPEIAHGGPCAGLNAGIRRALDVSRLPKSGFVARQIAIHQEFESRQVRKTTVATRLKEVCTRLENVAAGEQWSGRKLAAKIGVKESTFRKIKAGRADADFWLPKLEAAAARLAKPEVAN